MKDETSPWLKAFRKESFGLPNRDNPDIPKNFELLKKAKKKKNNLQIFTKYD